MCRKWILVEIVAGLAWSRQLDPKPAVSLALIEGTVRTADGQPFAGSDVVLLPVSCVPVTANAPSPPPPPPAIERSDADGKFSFRTVQPDACYVIDVQHSGYPGAQYPPQGSLTLDRGPTLNLAAGQRLSGLVITLTRAILSGKVTNEDGEPMSGVLVRPIAASGLESLPIQILTMGGVKTDSEGKFQLTDLAYGRYYLAFWLPPNTVMAKAGAPEEPELDYVNTYYPGVQSLADAQTVEALAGEVLNGLNVRLNRVPVFHVRGKVTGLPANVSLADGEVRVFPVPPDGDLYPAQNNPGRKVASDGSFDYDGLPPGTWTLILTAHQYDLLQKPIRITDRNIDGMVLASQVPVELKGSVTVIPELPPGTGSTVKPLGMPDVVRLVPDDVVARTQVSRVYPDGTFSIISVGASKYSVEVAPLNGAYLKSATLAGKDVLSTGIDFREGTHNGALQIVVSLFSGRVSGTVKKEDGQPAAGALVVAIPEHGPSAGRDPQIVSDQNGGFILNLGPGKYRLYAWEGAPRLNLNIAVSAALLKQFESLSAAITVAENDRLKATLTWISNAQVEARIQRHGQ